MKYESRLADRASTGEWLPILLVVSSTEKESTFFSLSPLAPTNLVSRDGFGRLVPHYNSSLAQSPYDTLAELNLALTLAGFVFRDGVHLYRQPPSGQSRVYRITQLRADGVTVESPPAQGR